MESVKQITHVSIPVDVMNRHLQFLASTPLSAHVDGEWRPLSFAAMADIVLPLKHAADASFDEQQKAAAEAQTQAQRDE